MNYLSLIDYIRKYQTSGQPWTPRNLRRWGCASPQWRLRIQKFIQDGEVFNEHSILRHLKMVKDGTDYLGAVVIQIWLSIISDKTIEVLDALLAQKQLSRCIRLLRLYRIRHSKAKRVEEMKQMNTIAKKRKEGLQKWIT